MEAPATVVPDVVQSVETPPTVQHDDAMPKAALTPPTSEDNDPKREERMSSELSDIDSDDGEDIEPDHYWDGGKIPVFKPVCCERTRTACRLHVDCGTCAAGAMNGEGETDANAVLRRLWSSFTTSSASLRRWTSME
jgi:hypothetical protein